MVGDAQRCYNAVVVGLLSPLIFACFEKHPLVKVLGSSLMHVLGPAANSNGGL